MSDNNNDKTKKKDDDPKPIHIVVAVVLILLVVWFIFGRGGDNNGYEYNNDYDDAPVSFQDSETCVNARETRDAMDIAFIGREDNELQGTTHRFTAVSTPTADEIKAVVQNLVCLGADGTHRLPWALYRGMNNSQSLAMVTFNGILSGEMYGLWTAFNGTEVEPNIIIDDQVVEIWSPTFRRDTEYTR